MTPQTLPARRRGWTARAGLTALVGGLTLAAAAAAAAAAAVPVAGAAAPSVREFEGTVVRAGGMGSSTEFPGADAGARGRFLRFETNREIKGIAIEYTGYLDDGSDPAAALAAARQLVRQNKVLAIVPNLSRDTPGDFLARRRVPWFGWGFDAAYCSPSPSSSVYGFGYNGCLAPPDPRRVPDVAAPLFAHVSVKTGNPSPTVAVFSEASAEGEQAVALVAPSYAGAGFDVVLARGVVPPPVVDDISRDVEQLLTAKDGAPPDAMACLAPVDCARVWQVLRANNYRGTFSAPLALYTDSVVREMAGAVVQVSYVPLDAGTPAQLQMVADVRAADPNAVVTPAVAASYFAADMLIRSLQAVKKAKLEVTPESVQEVAARSTFEVPGLYGPAKYPKSTVFPSPACSALVASDGQAWRTVVPYACSARTYPVTR